METSLLINRRSPTSNATGLRKAFVWLGMLEYWSDKPVGVLPDVGILALAQSSPSSSSARRCVHRCILGRDAHPDSSSLSLPFLSSLLS